MSEQVSYCEHYTAEERKRAVERRLKVFCSHGHGNVCRSCGRAFGEKEPDCGCDLGPKLEPVPA